ncbi:ATP-binding protein [Microvirga calopogonii]|uniref:ATP-binding protein n=1 Tax=Microvirga calopogonii TaxID=2078013 RepID=UPI000E0D1358|nr:ATP-binding protein [Microvirga calopogonii]
MNTLTTTSVEATLGRKLITRADQFFSHSVDCSIDEMIQNSRRAKAKNVRFILEDGDLVIADDGHGLTADNAHILLMADGSNNDDATESTERAAGLGFFP